MNIQAASSTPFTALPSTLPLGQPLMDISMDWDGSVWGIDINGRGGKKPSFLERRDSVFRTQSEICTSKVR
jgi:hypothetical protein